MKNFGRWATGTNGPGPLTDPDLAHAVMGESRNPFFVPGRRAELYSFANGGMLGLLCLAWFYFQTITLLNVAALIALGGFAAIAIVNGIGKRRYRLDRLRAVSSLKASIDRRMEEAPSS